MKSSSRLWAKNLALVSLVGLLLLIAGCGGGGSQVPADQNRPTAETPIATALLSHEDTVITFYDSQTSLPTGVSLGIPAGAMDFDEDVTIRLFEPDMEAIPATLDDHELVSVFRFETDPANFEFNFDVAVNMPVSGNDSHLIVYELEDWVFPPDPSSEVIPAPSGVGIPEAPRDLWARPDNGFNYLTWTANLEPDIAGYNVYRSTSEFGIYAQVNPDLVTGTSYTDDNGTVNGQAYWYKIAAVDNEDPANESEQSDMVSATPGEYWNTVSIARVSGSTGSFPVYELGTYAIMRRTDFSGVLDIDAGYSLNNDFTPVGVEFYCTVTGLGAGTLFLWDFDDDSPLSYQNTLQNPTHTYTVAGTYYPSVTVNHNGIEETVTIGDPDAGAGGIKVSDAGDVVKFTPEVEIFQPTPPGPHEFLVPKEQLFAATAIDLDGTIVDYWWDFGDGTPTVQGDFDSVSGFYTVNYEFDSPGCSAFEVSFHAVDNGGSEGVDSVNMQINPLPPAEPDNFAITDVSADYIPFVELAWDPVTSVYPGFDIRYRVYINTTVPDNPTFETADTDFRFDETRGAALGNDWRFAVSAFYQCTPDFDLQSSLAGPIQIDILDTTPPDPPSDLGGTVNKIDPSQVILSWTASPTPDVVSYKVYRFTGNPGGVPPFDPVTLGGWDDITADDLDPTNTAFVDGLGPDGIPGANGFTEFYYVVTAVDASGNESFTAPQMPMVVPSGIVPYILLVDNTGEMGANGDDAENFEHREALIDLGLDEDEHFEIITSSDYLLDDPDGRQEFIEDLRLESREMVIWFTSNAFEEHVVGPFEVALLEDYLDGGGSLFLNGDDAAYSMWQSGLDNFLEDYLSIDVGEIDDLGANDQTDLIGVTGGIFANWLAHRNEPQGFEDSVELDPGFGGLLALAVNNWPATGFEQVGIQHHNTVRNYHAFFMTIGLEDINSASKRENVMLRIFNWADVPLP